MNDIIKIVPQVHPHRNKGKDGLPTIDIFARGSGERQPTPSQYNQEFSMAPEPHNRVEENMKQRGLVRPPQGLIKLFQHEAKVVSPVVAEYIKQAQSVREDKIFLSYHYDRQEYLQQFYMKDGLYSPKASETQLLMKDLLQNRMQKSEQSILEGIDRNDVLVYKKKDLAKEDLAELEKIDQARLIKIREGQLKSKLDVLNEKMEQVKYFSEASLRQQSLKLPVERMNNIEDQLDYKSFGLQSTKTRLAEQYVIKKKLERSQRARRKRAILEREQEEKLRREEQRTYNNSLMEKEKRDEILGVLQKRRMKLQEQRQKDKHKQEEFMKFLLEYKSKKPLYKEKEEEFRRRYILPLQQSKEQRLKEIRENHRQLSMDELIDHEKKYLEKKQQLSSKRQEEYKLMLSQRKQLKKDHFKSHFHELLEEEAAAVIDPIDLGHYRQEKRKEYGERLKKQHPPAVDENKKKELQELIQKVDRKGKRLKKRVVQLDDRTFDGNLENANVIVYEEVKQGDHKKDGLRYLQFARRIGERMKHRQESAKKHERDSQDKLHSETPQPTTMKQPNLIKKRYKPLTDYETQVRNNRILNSWTDDLKDDKLSSQQRLDRIRVKSMLLDGKARNKEQLLRFAHFDTPLLEIKKKAELDEHYISSIKAKVALLSMGD